MIFKIPDLELCLTHKYYTLCMWRVDTLYTYPTAQPQAPQSPAFAETQRSALDAALNAYYEARAHGTTHTDAAFAARAVFEAQGGLGSTTRFSAALESFTGALWNL